MHEASLVQGLLQLVFSALADYQKANGGACPRVTGISCKSGLLACFEPETLRACLEIFAEGTAAEGADLKISTEPLPCRCDACGHEFELAKRHFVCPQCGGDKLSFSGGNGLVLTAINIDRGD